MEESRAELLRSNATQQLKPFDDTNTTRNACSAAGIPTLAAGPVPTTVGTVARIHAE